MRACVSHHWYSRRRILAATVVVAAAFGTCCSARARSQALTASKPEPAFEVASVKLSPPGGDGLTYLSPYGEAKFVVRNVDLNLLLELAFGVEPYQIANAPSWAESQNYDIIAKPEGAGGLTYEQLKPLLQGLLKERFHLAVHRTSKEFQGYALVAAKSGPRLTPGKASPMMANILRGGLRCENITMKDLASILAHPAGKPVVDNSEISGAYNVKLDFAPEGSNDSTLPSLFTAVQEQLGLKLEPRKVPVEMLVIDSVNRVPIEN